MYEVQTLYKLECWTKLQNEQIKQANTIEVGQNLALAYNITSNADYKDAWYLDIRCNNHMCCQKELLLHFDE